MSSWPKRTVLPVESSPPQNGTKKTNEELGASPHAVMFSCGFHARVKRSRWGDGFGREAVGERSSRVGGADLQTAVLSGSEGSAATA